MRKRSAGSVPDIADDDSPAPTPCHLPGYRIERTLGHGGMGTVFLARQLSLDRPVALKVMSKRWSADPVFVARFVREAYAAALLNHPNVVQIYDIGEADGTRYFSMEFVPGRSLADLIKSDGKIDPETSVGYVLQAARGLKHAHDRGMIHRDVKPDNLLVTDQGMVKVADLGLVKTPDMAGGAAVDLTESGSGLRALPPDMTGTQMALGTPAYMAPEQCRDAATVDHRADIYALGCTLYALVTGRAPFDGNTAVELMTQHAYRPLVPPEQIAGRVPKELSAVIQKMMAKDPHDRYPCLGEVVRVLEQWLGVHRTGTFSPRDEQIEILEKHARAFTATPAAVLRRRVVTGFVTVCMLAAVGLMFLGQLSWAFGLAGLVLQSAAVYFLLNGIARRTYFFRRVRQFAAGFSLGDWTVVVGGVGLFTALLGVLGLLDVWIGFGLIGAGLAVGVRIGLDRSVDVERGAALSGCKRLLRKLRLHGVGEDELQQFVAKYAGRDWEEFFEALFGFEAKLTARAVLLRGGSSGDRAMYATWREPMIEFIDRVEKSRNETRERRLLARVEQARLEAAGVTETAARDRASVAADELVDKAKAVRAAEAGRHNLAGPADPTCNGMPSLKHIAYRWTDPNILLPEPPVVRLPWWESVAGFFISSAVRGLFAAGLLAAFLLWVHQNGLFGDAATRSFASATEPLQLDGIPAEWTAWCDSANAGWAGLLLLASLFYPGHRAAIFALIGAGITVFGHRYGLRGIALIPTPQLTMMAGTAIAILGFRLGNAAAAKPR